MRRRPRQPGALGSTCTPLAPRDDRRHGYPPSQKHPLAPASVTGFKRRVPWSCWRRDQGTARSEVNSCLHGFGLATENRTHLCPSLIEPLIRTRAEAATYVTAAIAALS